MAARRKRRSPAEQARERMYRKLVLENAERVFAEKGYHAARMQDVAAEAGISLATLYGAFPGKEDVFLALHEARGEAFLARIEPSLHEAAPARVALWHSVRAFVAFLTEHDAYFRMDLREGRSWAVGDVRTSAAFQKGIAQWTALIARGIDEGVFREDDPGVLATTVFGLMQTQLAALLAADPAADADAVARRIAASVERQVCTLDALAEPPPWEAEPATRAQAR